MFEMKLLTSCFNKKPLLELTSRIVMAPMTRGFCGKNHTATYKMADYYGRRAEAGVGLIITEGTIVHPSGDGYNNVPHISTLEQADSWKKVIDRVHSSGAKMFCQLWHTGRISHADFTGGLAPVSSTNQQAEGVNRQNGKPYGVPRALEPYEMRSIYGYFGQAAKNALNAGFDGIQIHMGHGYLIDQFLDGSINDRKDAYGGSVVNRCRFAVELLETVVESIGAEKVMVRISPSREFFGQIRQWPDMDEMINYLIPAFESIGLRMLDVSCASSDYFKTAFSVIRKIRPIFSGLIIGGASLPQNLAEKEIVKNYLDLVTYGRFLIANPDLVEKFRMDSKLTPFDRDLLKTLY